MQNFSSSPASSPSKSWRCSNDSVSLQFHILRDQMEQWRVRLWEKVAPGRAYIASPSQPFFCQLICIQNSRRGPMEYPTQLCLFSLFLYWAYPSHYQLLYTDGSTWILRDRENDRAVEFLGPLCKLAHISSCRICMRLPLVQSPLYSICPTHFLDVKTCNGISF